MGMFAILHMYILTCPSTKQSCLFYSGIPFSVSTQSFDYNGDLVSALYIDLVINTGMLLGYWEWNDINNDIIYSMLYLENVKNYDQGFP